MTRWEIERTRGADGCSVVKVTDDTREVVRARWVGLSCIDAQVIAAELQRAYDQGREDAMREVRESMFGA